MELVNLFKELMKRGWKVYGEYDKLMSYGQTRGKRDFGFGVLGEIKYSLRELVSKESGLWQFVCENRMTKKMEKIPRGIWINSWHKSAYEKCPVYTMEKAEYRIIESSLIDEDKLEKFLIENIKI